MKFFRWYSFSGINGAICILNTEHICPIVARMPTITMNSQNLFSCNERMWFCTLNYREAQTEHSPLRVQVRNLSNIYATSQAKLCIGEKRVAISALQSCQRPKLKTFRLTINSKTSNKIGCTCFIVCFREKFLIMQILQLCKICNYAIQPSHRFWCRLTSGAINHFIGRLREAEWSSYPRIQFLVLF